MKFPGHVGLVAIGGAGWMGGAHYVRHLATALRSAAAGMRISFLCGETLVADWVDTTPRIDIPTRRSFFRRMVARRGGLRKAIERAGIEFVYPLTYDNQYNLALQFPIADQLGSARWVGWIPDFQHRYLPEFFPREEVDRREKLIGELVSEASRIVFSSDNAATDFRAFYPEHAAKGAVLKFATPPFDLRDDGCGDPAEIPERFFLVCNQFWKHKNHLVVFEALRLLRSRSLAPPVLCTGQLDDHRDRAYAGQIRAALGRDNLHDQVRLLGLIPRAQQIALMRRAIGVIQPSLFEGWSSVVEDARTLGRRCLLSDIAVHREQDPPGARFFPPRSAEVLADLMAEAFSTWEAGPDYRAEAEARERARARLLAMGRRFLEIAAPSGP